MTAAAERVAGVMERFEAVIGIEVHCQLRTASKMFCGCSTSYDGAAPNTHVCPVCLGLPGTLPTINRRAVEFVIATGLAIDATIPVHTQWERKNYFYPDLPKGYQISQYAIPLAASGRLAIETSAGPFVVGITRAHLEEDTAKLVHADAVRAGSGPGGRASLVDFNRSGAPLMEIVTEPDIRTAEQARRYAEELQLLLRAIGVSDADMERGQMRVEANVSLRPRGTEPFGTRVEVKNMNSFRAVERAIGFEIERQARAIDAGETLVLETRGWDDGKQATYRMRSKETSEDYRYFREPDLPPLHVEPAWIDRVRAELPELPAARRARYVDARDHGVRRGGDRRGPRDDHGVRGDPRGRRGTGEGDRELRHRPARSPRQGRRPESVRDRGRLVPGRDRAADRGHRRRPGVAADGAGAAGPPRLRRCRRVRAAGGRGSRSDLERRGAAAPRGRGDRGEPRGRRPTTARAGP